MELIYNKIFQLNFKHKISECFKTIRISPTNDTQQILRNYKLLFKQKQNSIFILQTQNDEKAPFVLIEQNLNLRFIIDFNYNSLIPYTDIDLYNPAETCLYFTIDTLELNNNWFLSKENLIPIKKSIDAPVINPFTLETIEISSIKEGVYLTLNDSNPFAFYSLKNNNIRGFIDIILSKEMITAEYNETNIIFNDRLIYLYYNIFDKKGIYSNFSIESSKKNFSFLIEKSENKTLIRSEALLNINQLKENYFTLIGERRNGRSQILIEKLPIPAIENLGNINNSSNFYLNSFLYV